MDINNIKNIKLKELKITQDSFEESIKILEKNIAESITNKKKLVEMKKDLKQADEKFSDAKRYLDNLKIELGKNKQISFNTD